MLRHAHLLSIDASSLALCKGVGALPPEPVRLLMLRHPDMSAATPELLASKAVRLLALCHSRLVGKAAVVLLTSRAVHGLRAHLRRREARTAAAVKAGERLSAMTVTTAHEGGASAAMRSATASVGLASAPWLSTAAAAMRSAAAVLLASAMAAWAR